MDPVACLLHACDLVDADSFAEAKESLANYAAWRKRGGFEPSMLDATGFNLDGDEWASNLADTMAQRSEFSVDDTSAARGE